MVLEACVETLEEALKARELGAHRIELCSRLDLTDSHLRRNLSVRYVQLWQFR